jgi:hypothetical protein
MSTTPNKTTANKQIGGVTFTIGDDPRGTSQIVEEAIRELQRRFREFRGVLRTTVGYENDALRLTINQEAEEKEEFGATEAGSFLLLGEFIRWVKEQLNAVLGLLLSPVEVQQGVHWLSGFLDNAVIQGVNQSTGLLFQSGIDIENIPNEDILDRTEFRNVLFGQSGRYYKSFNDFTNLRGDIVQTIRRETQRGIDQNWTPRKLADTLTKEVRTLERQRASTIVRTQMAAAHTDAALQNYERAGVGTVGHVGRVTAGDTSVCAFCRRIRDEAFTIPEFTNTVVQWRGKVYRVGIPSHPNGRCIVVPRPDVDVNELAPLSERVPGRIIQS